MRMSESDHCFPNEPEKVALGGKRVCSRYVIALSFFGSVLVGVVAQPISAEWILDGESLGSKHVIVTTGYFSSLGITWSYVIVATGPPDWALVAYVACLLWLLSVGRSRKLAAAGALIAGWAVGVLGKVVVLWW